MQKIKAITITLFVVACGLIFASAKECNDVIKSVDNNEMKIALSFDDGPHPLYTPEILYILREHQIKATFFVIGKNASYYPEILSHLNEEGHEIGNHTFTHSLKKNINKKDMTEELQKSSEIIKKICGYEVRLFRPPGGILNNSIRETANDLGYKIVLWNIDTRDWANVSVDSITKNVLQNTKSGSIILFHDYIYKNSPTAEALRTIIPTLKERGYLFVTVGELIDSSQKTNTN